MKHQLLIDNYQSIEFPYFLVAPNLLFNHFNVNVMALAISNYNNFFKVKGVLNKRNIQQFQEAFHNALDVNNEITISIEGLETIDRYGVNALVKLHNEALTKNKRLSIVGSGLKELFDYFKSEEAA
ncbi:STAS domain-containing protein [Winogradskyella sp. 3972H.M.0a.05]|uniref:STAS domain-containing protein n=1 Tax=Winogradskyella sp. 3972H.M.0a.05 TaxID=2950277 RepID=UPI003399507F